jgi:hypothetical protein
MSPIVAEYVSLLPVSPVSHVWFDVTEQSGFRFIFSEWTSKNPLESLNKNISDLPMPFDRIGLIITIKSPENNSHSIPYPVLVDRNGPELTIKGFMIRLAEPAFTIIFKENFNYEDSFTVRFHPKYLKAINVDPKDVSKLDEEYANTAELVMTRIFLLCYGIPAQGCKIIGAKLRDHHHNAKRRAKGKRQFFEWTTVEIDLEPRRKEVAPQGGTHASPKPHDRRGHQRRLRSGKVVYVRSCTINKHKIKEEGFIHHDYQVIS